MSIKKIKGPAIAFISGLFLCLISVGLLELYCYYRSPYQIPFKIPPPRLSVAELQKKFPGGIFPELPELIPVDKRYTRPFDRFFDATFELKNIPVSKEFHSTSHREIYKRASGEVLWDVEFLFDKYRRRIVPADHNKKDLNQFLALFGDSNIEGYGLQADNTIANFLSKQFPEKRIYNYAQSGTFPYEILERIDQIQPENELPEKNGTALYFYFDYHIVRNMGGVFEIGPGWTGEKHDVGIDDKGEFIVKGLMKNERPLWYRLAPFLRDTYTFRYFHWDLKPEAEDYKTQTAFIKKMRDKLLSKGMKNFYVVIHPKNPGEKNGLILTSYLYEEKIPFIYMGHWNLPEIVEGPSHLVFDSHISGNANKVIAEGILRALDKEHR